MVIAKNMWRIGDVAVLLVLSLYLVIGRNQAPFHGDEASHVFTSRDYYYLVHEHNFHKVFFSTAWTSPQEQFQRLMTGTIHKMGIGLALDLAGFKVTDLNRDWDWSLGVKYNVTAHHMPGTHMLRVARTSSLVFTILSFMFVLLIAVRLIPNRIGAWIGTAVYATAPGVLLDGRRVMMEGAMLCCSALLVLVTLWVIRGIEHPTDRRRMMLAYIAFGLASGLALASKLNTLFTVMAAFLAIALARNAGCRAWRVLWHHNWIECAGGIAVLTLVALTPAWWPDPLRVAAEVASQRIDLIDLQARQTDSYPDLGDRVEGLVKWALYGGPQYYESPRWAQEPTTQAQIKRYEADHLAGRMGGPLWGIGLGILLVIGNIALFSAARRQTAALVVLLWLWVNALGLLITNPLPWSRYYLVIQAPVALCVGAGAGASLQVIRRAVIQWQSRQAAQPTTA